MFSRDGVKHFIIGVQHGVTAVANRSCIPGDLSIYTSVHWHLDWIGHLIGDERCISNAMRWEPEKLFAFLSAIALATLSASLIIYLIVNELQKANNL